MIKLGTTRSADSPLYRIFRFKRHSARTADVESLLADLPVVRGDWPVLEPARLIVFACCDPAYLAEHGMALARSLDRNSPGAHLHFHLINPDASAERNLQDLDDEIADTALSRTEERFDFSGHSSEFARTYCASIRFVRLFQLMRAVTTDVLLLDVDVLVRDDLGPLRESVNGYDCAIHTRFRKRRDREKLFASVFYAAQTPGALAYLENVATRICSAIARREARWFLDQRALYGAYRASGRPGPAVRLGHLPDRYADRAFDKRSVIWAGKASRGELDETFLAQRAAYIPKAKKLAATAPAAAVARPRVTVVLPRLDLPFKNPGGLRGLPDRLRRRSPQDMRLRAHWQAMADAVRAAFERRGCDATVIAHPLWRVTTAFLDRLDADIVLIPHKQRFQFGHLRRRSYFYTQATVPWLFTVDPLGWSGGSSVYPCDYSAGDPESGTYESYVERMVRRNGSKYDQRAPMKRSELVARGEIPDGPYIFFACQRPTDQAIRFFSRHDEVDVVRGLAEWAEQRGLGVVFKAHPTNAASARPFEDATRGHRAYWSTASVHDLIAYSDAVYVINSGVGFEAILHNKPVVTFGQVEYDAVSIHGDPAALDLVWQHVGASDPHRRLAVYKRFVDWYCRLYCVDLADPRAMDARLTAIVDDAVHTQPRTEPAGPTTAAPDPRDEHAHRTHDLSRTTG